MRIGLPYLHLEANGGNEKDGKRKEKGEEKEKND